jgi:hypothetical protein
MLKRRSRIKKKRSIEADLRLGATIERLHE